GERLRCGGRRLDLRRLHLELGTLKSLNGGGGCLLHLVLLRADQLVELCHPRASRLGPLVVASVHGFAQNARTFRLFGVQGNELTPQPEELLSGARVDGERLESIAGGVADGVPGRSNCPTRAEDAEKARLCLLILDRDGPRLVRRHLPDRSLPRLGLDARPAFGAEA